MYYSIIDKDVKDFEDPIPSFSSCGLNSKSPEEIKENILQYIRTDIEDLTDYRVLKNSSIDELLELFHLDIYKHEHLLPEFPYLIDFKEV
jgi:hypothetical protein